jgi:hypothetical protein
VSIRFAVSFVALAWSAGSAASAGDMGATSLEGLLAPRLPFSATTASLPALHLVWIDPTGVATGVDALARSEAGRLLRAMGVRVSWRRGECHQEARAGEVRVVLLDRGAARDRFTPVLGATPPRFEGAPLVWVLVPGVRAVIGLSPHESAASMRPSDVRDLAFALGRVVAHETVHAVAPWVRHGAGLMSARLTRRQLTAHTIPVELEVSLAVQAALRGEPSAAGPGTGVVAAAAIGEEVAR